MSTKPRMVKPYTSAWEKKANQMARDFAPRIKPCGECGGPVVHGYCCRRCGSNDPDRAYREAREAQA